MLECKKCKKPLNNEKDKLCSLCYSERSKKRADIVRGIGKAAIAIVPIAITIFTGKRLKK